MPQDDPTDNSLDPNGDDVVDTAGPRWAYTNDWIGALYLLAFTAMTTIAGGFSATVAFGRYKLTVIASTDLMAVPVNWRLAGAAVALIAAAWVFGSGAVKAVSKLRTK